MGKLEALREFWGRRARGAWCRSRATSRSRTSASRKADLRKLTGKVKHLFHLGAVYDLQASAEEQDLANIVGTEHALAVRATRCRPAASTS